LDEPGGPPWNVISGVNEEIGGLSLVARELKSISDGSEFLKVLDEDEHGQTADVEVENEDLVSQPCHYHTIVSDRSALGEVYSILDLQNDDKEGHHLEHLEEVGEDSLVVVVEDLEHIVGNETDYMRQHSHFHQVDFATVDELLGF